MTETTAVPPPELEKGPFGNLRFDVLAGFLVFLIAMPLCLAIAKASGFPPIAGIWTAVIGGIMCTLISDSELTIKGPAAGLIVIIAGAVTELGNEFGAGLPDGEKALIGYKLALGIGVASGIIQILFGVFRLGRLADFFPLTPVHGMLASIGVIIVAKQAYEVVGVTPEKGAGPLKLLANFPGALSEVNPEIAIIGVVSLLIMFGLPWIKNPPWLKRVPSQMIVLIVAVILGSAWVFNLDTPNTYPFHDSFFDSEHFRIYGVDRHFLVDMPNVLEDPSTAFFLPDFRGLATVTGLKYLVLYALIGSLESLLSAKAIEILDPWRRKTNFDRDLLAIGIANTLSALVGGLPMIAEIVRSKANIDNGARTRKANLFHGLFLLAFVLAVPSLIHSIPLAALGAMLVYTGFRLASPNEFVRTFKIGGEQFLIFVVTIVATLATDLLIGILTGIALEAFIYWRHGAPLTSMFRSHVNVVPDGDGRVILQVERAAVFGNWLGLRGAIMKHSEAKNEVVIDLSRTRVVDHSVMEKLHELEKLFKEAGKNLHVIGLEKHQPLAGAEPFSARVA